ncbi:hypothetical protein BRADI_2g00655v3 [Brachypodium distachyon]|uniref:Uncharacterized protein n=1 Tax=Brachypodium distachyon TaxID=15368 RepID=A0A2K2D6A3_BRADI|nr:hypothetical protein BRADI_2g00655v3 [Brachypodium distachyon]
MRHLPRRQEKQQCSKAPGSLDLSFALFLQPWSAAVKRSRRPRARCRIRLRQPRSRRCVFAGIRDLLTMDVLVL